MIGGILSGQDMPADPIHVARRLGGTGHEIELVFREPDEAEVALKAAARIEHAAVGELADGHVGVIWRKPIEHAHGVAAFEHEFAERGFIEERDVLARGAMLLGDAAPPILTAEGILHGGFCAVANKPDRALDRHFAAEDCALSQQPIVQRTAPRVAAGFQFVVRPGHAILQAGRFRHAVAEEIAVVLIGREATDVHRPQVGRLFAREDPLRQRIRQRHRRKRGCGR